MGVWIGGASEVPLMPPNDLFVHRTLLTGAEAIVVTDTRRATREPGEPLHAGVWGGHSLWWRWDAPIDGDVRITTDGSEVDTLLAVYTGSELGSLKPVAANDDHGLGVSSRIRFSAVRGISYAIAVDSIGSDARSPEGPVVMRLEFIPEPIRRPVNDAFGGRSRLLGSPVGQRVETSNRNATREPGEPTHAQVVGDTSVWWEWTPEDAKPVMLSTEGSDFDTVLAVYTGEVLGSLTPVVVNDDVDSSSGVLFSQAAFRPVAGRRYFIAVDGFDGAQGAVRLSMTPWTLHAEQVQRTAGEGVQFRVPGLVGTRQTLESSLDPRCCWVPVPQWENSGGTGTFVVPVTPGSTGRFYRIISTP